MTLAAEITDLETTLREAGIALDGVLQTAGINRSTWTRWKNGSVRGARYDAISRIRDAASAALTARKEAA